MREADEANGDREHEKRETGGIESVRAEGGPGGGETCEHGGEYRRESHGEFTFAEDAKCGACKPIVERRFFKPRLAKQSRRDPVTGTRHCASNRGVARLVRAGKPDSADAAQKADGHERKRQQQVEPPYLARRFCGGA